MAYWNLGQLANAIVPLLKDIDPLREVMNSFSSVYEKRAEEMMIKKLGLVKIIPETDKSLIAELLHILSLCETDRTLFFRGLAELKTEKDLCDREIMQPLMSSYYNLNQVTPEIFIRTVSWLKQYVQRLRLAGILDLERKKQMNAVNPKYILRNYLAQLAIEKAENGDFSLVHETLDVMRRPYDEQPTKDSFAAKRPDWARTKPGCSMLSCSS